MVKGQINSPFSHGRYVAGGTTVNELTKRKRRKGSRRRERERERGGKREGEKGERKEGKDY